MSELFSGGKLTARRIRAHYMGLALILGAGLALRLWGISFGLPNLHCRPDESTLVNKALAIGSGDLNPHFFNYPSFHFYVLACIYGFFFLCGWASGAFTGIADFQHLFFTDPSVFYIIGRIFSALLGSGSVGVIYLIGRRLENERTGLLAAFFLSLAFLHVRDSHFLTVDIPATFYMLLGCLFALRHLAKPASVDWLWSAVCCGLAASTKYNLGLFGIVPLVAVWTSSRFREISVSWAKLLGVVGAMLLVFVTVSPFVVLDFPSFWRDLSYERLHFSAGHGGFELQAGRGWLHHLQFTLRHGLGWPLLVVALLGVGRMLWRRRPEELVLLSGMLVYYVVAGSGRTVFMRYMLPVVPLLCVAAGTVCQATVRRRGGAFLLAAALIVPSAHAAWQHDRILTRPDTRLLAAQWIEEEIPDGASIAMHGSDFGFPQVRRNRVWLRDQLEVARKAGQRGRRLTVMLEWEDYPPAPSFYVVELQAENPLHRRAVWTSYDADRLRANGIEWIVTHDHPLVYSQVAPRLEAELAREAMLVQRFEPFNEDGQIPLFDPTDAYYAPVAGYGSAERPGPLIRIYRLK
jgi:hypothetical protein